MTMEFSTRFKLLLAATLISGAVVSWPFLSRMRAIRVCLDRGDFWDYSAHRCEPPVNPHPAATDSAAMQRATPHGVPAP